MITTKLDIPCIWGGTLAGVLLKNDTAVARKIGQTITKIVGVHGWLDNLNSLLPLAKQIIDRHPNYEIFLYDRAGHGFSSHIPKGFDYSAAHNTQDLRIVIQSLGWNKDKFAIIGHSYGAILGMTYAASYPEEVSCLVALDALPRVDGSRENFFKVHGARIDASLAFHNKPPRAFNADLTFASALELTQMSRIGISEEAARLLTERSVRLDVNNKLHFTRDEALKILSLVPFTTDMAKDTIERIKAAVLFIGATEPQWPRAQASVDFLKEQNPNFEMTLMDGPHHLHMTHVSEVVDRIEQYFSKHLPEPSASTSTDRET